MEDLVGFGFEPVFSEAFRAGLAIEATRPRPPRTEEAVRSRTCLCESGLKAMSTEPLDVGRRG